jgi:hypothetical protein
VEVGCGARLFNFRLENLKEFTLGNISLPTLIKMLEDLNNLWFGYFLVKAADHFCEIVL